MKRFTAAFPLIAEITKASGKKTLALVGGVSACQMPCINFCDRPALAWQQLFDIRILAGGLTLIH